MLRFTSWDQTEEEGVLVQALPVPTFVSWEQPTQRPRIVPRNLPGENVEVYGHSPFSVAFACSLRRNIFEFLSISELLRFRSAWQFIARIVVVERPAEPEAEPEADNQRIAFLLRFN